MKYVLFIFLLLWPVMGWAGQYKPNELCMSGGGLESMREVPCPTEPRPNIEIIKNDRCIAKMEAAMRAIDPFLGTAFGKQMEPRNRRTYLKALDLWLVTSRDCWKETP